MASKTCNTIKSSSCGDDLSLHSNGIEITTSNSEEFSADEDIANTAKIENIYESGEINNVVNNVYDLEYVEKLELSDDELFETLNKYGAEIGPIVASTRKVYMKMLARLMSENQVDFEMDFNPKKTTVVQNGGDAKAKGDEYSADESDQKISSANGRVSYSSKSPEKKLSSDLCNSWIPSSEMSSSRSIRQRFQGSDLSSPQSYIVTPRRSIYSYGTGNADTGLNKYEKAALNYSYQRHNKKYIEPSLKATSSVKNKNFRNIGFFVVALIFLMFGYYIYTNFFAILSKSTIDEVKATFEKMEDHIVEESNKKL